MENQLEAKQQLNKKELTDCLSCQDFLYEKVKDFLNNNKNWYKAFERAFKYPELLYRQGKIDLYDYNALIGNLDGVTDVIIGALASDVKIITD